MSEEFCVKDVAEFADIIRLNAAETLIDRDIDNNTLNQFVTIGQIIGMIDNKSLGYNEEGDLIINSLIFEDIFDEVTQMIYQSSLSKLAAKGTIECAWDEEKDTMIFWNQ
jgi:hypothetical protein